MPSSSEATEGEPSPLAHKIAGVTAKLRADHKHESTALQRAIDRLTALVGWPGFVLALVVVIVIWAGGNFLAARLAGAALDPPPFAWLQAVMGSGALIVSVLILTTQRREDRLSSHRLQLILELSIVNDRKIAKLIALIEEVRRDNPALHDRVDGMAATMSEPSDPHSVLQAIKDVRDGPR